MIGKTKKVLDVINPIDDSFLDLPEQELKDKVIDKHNAKDFWRFWNTEKHGRWLMELRTNDKKTFNHLKRMAKKIVLPVVTNGVLVNNEKDFDYIINNLPTKSYLWYGINPRRKAYNFKGVKVFGSGDGGGCADVNVKSIGHVLIDVDVIKKESRPSTVQELKNAYNAVKLLLDHFFSIHGHMTFCTINSGNGIQCVIPLYSSYDIPELKYSKKLKSVKHNKEFILYKNLVKLSVGRFIEKNKQMFKDKYNVEVDPKVFNLSRVAATPFTYNVKHGTPQYRYIIQIARQPSNVGNMDFAKKIKEQCMLNISKVSNDFKGSKSKGDDSECDTKYKLKQGEVLSHPFSRFLLENDFPIGECNNVLWMSYKALVYDSGMSFIDDEVLQFREMLQTKWGSVRLTTNAPRGHFHPEVIIDYAFRNGIAPPFKPFINRIIERPFFDFSKINMSDLWADYYTPLYNVTDKDMKISQEIWNLYQYMFLKSQQDRENLFGMTPHLKKREGRYKQFGDSIGFNKHAYFSSFLHYIKTKHGEDQAILCRDYWLPAYFNFAPKEKPMREVKPKNVKN